MNKHIIKRLVKLIGFIPMMVITTAYFPIAIVKWVITGILPPPPIAKFIEW